MKSCDCFLCNGFFLDDEEECTCEINQDATPPAFKKTHTCKPKEYIGLLERYFYCEDCGIKLENI